MLQTSASVRKDTQLYGTHFLHVASKYERFFYKTKLCGKQTSQILIKNLMVDILTSSSACIT